MSEDAYLLHLKRRYNFAGWEGVRRLELALHVRGFTLGGTQLRDLQPERIEPASPSTTTTVSLHIERKRDTTRAASLQLPPARLSKSFWRPVPISRALVNIDSYEGASASHAHELLLQVLGGFQSTLLVRRDDLDIGDIAFAMPGCTALAFARGNLAHLVRNASREFTDVTEIARQLDQQLLSRPAGTGTIAHAPVDPATGYHRLSAAPPAAAPTAAPLYLKLFTAAGTLAAEDDQIVLHPSDNQASYEVGIVAVYPQGRQVQRIQRVGERKPKRK